MIKQIQADYYDGDRQIFVAYLKGTESAIPTECQVRDDFSEWTNCYLRSVTYIRLKNENITQPRILNLYRCEYKAY